MRRLTPIFFLTALLLAIVYPALAYMPAPSIHPPVYDVIATSQEFETDPVFKPPGEVYTPSISEWSSGRYFTGSFGTIKGHVPADEVVWIVCQNNPVNYTDPTGRALFAFDGTWQNMNDPSIGVMTNIGYLYRAYAGPGKPYYYEGVGTDGWDILLGGVLGYGVGNRIDRAYEDLYNSYNSGDETIVIVGFSRGATAARAFANKIATEGIPLPDGKGTVYPKIQFLGLFDTVGSIGVPGNNINWGYDLAIPWNVQRVRQAVAMDEERLGFPLTSINFKGDMSERYFTGAHSDVGGSYDNYSLSLEPLMWMINESGGLFHQVDLNNISFPDGVCGPHESRSWIERFLLPNGSRNVY